MERSFDQGGVSYILDKSRLSIRLIAPYREERRQKAREQGKHRVSGLSKTGIEN